MPLTKSQCLRTAKLWTIRPYNSRANLWHLFQKPVTKSHYLHTVKLWTIRPYNNQANANNSNKTDCNDLIAVLLFLTWEEKSDSIYKLPWQNKSEQELDFPTRHSCIFLSTLVNCYNGYEASNDYYRDLKWLISRRTSCYYAQSFLYLPSVLVFHCLMTFLCTIQNTWIQFSYSYALSANLPLKHSLKLFKLVLLNKIIGFC